MDSIPIYKIDPFLKPKSGITSQIIKILTTFKKGDQWHNILYQINYLNYYKIILIFFFNIPSGVSSTDTVMWH